jgi:GT2 family glycosyltransferase
VTVARVSVVVITRNRRIELIRTLDRLRDLPEAPEVIVVDNGSDDDTAAAVATRHPAVRLLALSTNAGAAARNVGVAAARSPLVAFSDDDSWWAPGSLRCAATSFESHPRLALLAARVLVGLDERVDPVCAAMAASPLRRAPDLPGPSVLGFLACGAVVRRVPFLDAGGFPEGYGVGGEEAPLALALAGDGWGLAYVPDVVAHHHPSPRREQFARQARQHRNDLWTAWTRLPALDALRTSATLLRDAPHDPAVRAGAADAILGLGVVRSTRRRVPKDVARQWRALERTGRVAATFGAPDDGAPGRA